MLWEPAIYEHKAALIGKSPIETACSTDLLTESLLKEYEVYCADFLCVGIDIYNIEAEACGAELTVAGDSVSSINETAFSFGYSDASFFCR